MWEVYYSNVYQAGNGYLKTEQYLRFYVYIFMNVFLKFAKYYGCLLRFNITSVRLSNLLSIQIIVPFGIRYELCTHIPIYARLPHEVLIIHHVNRFKYDVDGL